MTGPTHAISGIAAFVAVTRILGIEPTAVQLLACLVGSLAPDIDTDGTISRPGTLFRFFLGWKLGKVIDKLFAGVSALINLAFGHRGFIHAPIVGIGLMAIGVWWQQAWLEWFGVGYLIHLVGDLLTPMGIPLLSPFSAEQYHLVGLRSGSRAEVLLASGLALFVIVAGWPLLPEAVKKTHIVILEMITT